MEIDPQFVDVDFQQDPRFVFGDLGSPAFCAMRDYESTTAIIPRSEWEGEAEKIAASGGGAERLVTRIYDQGREGSCVANACSQAHEVVQAKQFGKENVVHLSAISLYKRIGRSPGSGAMVSDGLEEMSTKGILPLDNPENRAQFGGLVMPNTGFYTAYPTNWEQMAKHFRSAEWDIIRTLEGMGTALLNQQPVVVGRQGHSICYVGLVFKNGRMYAPYPNSWSLDWGSPMGDHPGGFGMDSESQIKMSASWAFTLRSVVIPSN